MRTNFLVCAFFLFGAVPAKADPLISFDGAVPGESFESIIATLPEAYWREFRDESGTLVGAVGSDAVMVNDWRWTLRLGQTHASETDDFSYSFEVNSMRRFDREDECATALSTTIAALEPRLGPYTPGRFIDVFPQWADLDTRAPPREMSLGGTSHINVYARERTRYMIGIRPISMGAATLAYVCGINTRSRALNGRWGYDCQLSIAFKAPTRNGDN